ncbi:MAG: STAS domain-containing protein [Chloroflexota bacterium]
MLEIKIDDVPAGVPVTVMRLAGELDASCYQDVISKARSLYENGKRNLLLDLSNLSFMASSGLVSLYNLAIIMRGEQVTPEQSSWNALHEIRGQISSAMVKEQQFKLLTPQPRILKTLKMTGFDQFLDVYFEEVQAINSFQEA